eukprot:21216-Chlamydomonas_euryale.AAC.26
MEPTSRLALCNDPQLPAAARDGSNRGGRQQSRELPPASLHERVSGVGASSHSHSRHDDAAWSLAGLLRRAGWSSGRRRIWLEAGRRSCRRRLKRVRKSCSSSTSTTQMSASYACGFNM